MKITPKVEKFCQGIVAGLSQADAYRSAYNVTNMKAKSIHENASRLMADAKVKARIQELMAPVVAKVQVTKDQWIDKMQSFFHADVRKMFTGPGDLIEIHELGDHEAVMVKGFELVENFEKVGNKAEHVGYTKKVKLESKLKAMLELGKVMGWYQEAQKLPPAKGLVIVIQRDAPAVTQTKTIDVTPKNIKPTGTTQHKPVPVRIERG